MNGRTAKLLNSWCRLAGLGSRRRAFKRAWTHPKANGSKVRADMRRMLELEVVLMQRQLKEAEKPDLRMGDRRLVAMKHDSRPGRMSVDAARQLAIESLADRVQGSIFPRPTHVHTPEGSVTPDGWTPAAEPNEPTS